MTEINLTRDQQKAFDLMVEGKNIFLTGPGGCGKSTVINLFKNKYQDKRKIAITSTTGISAILIGGCTLHSFCGIGLGTSSVEELVEKIQKNVKVKRRILEVDTLVIDEVSMLSPDLFDKIESIFSIIRSKYRQSFLSCENGCTKPFGGVQLILSGDFLQLPVVNSDKFCFQSEKWEMCIDNTIDLTDILRQTDTNFQTILNDIRYGQVTERAKKMLSSRIGVELKNEYGIKPTKIFTTNNDVNYINEQELNKLNEEGVEFYQYDMEVYLLEYVTNKEQTLEKYRKSCLAPDRLELCVGCQVMLLANLETESGIANGSRGVVVKFIEDLPVVKFMNGHERIIEHYTWKVEEAGKELVRITQIPLKLAYAITVHKSQSLTLDCVEIDLSNIFTFGLAYVALSRVKTLEGMKITDIDFARVEAHPEAVRYYKNLKEQEEL
jgi:ATP-dependent DNA helicase PIF1